MCISSILSAEDYNTITTDKVLVFVCDNDVVVSVVTSSVASNYGSDVSVVSNYGSVATNTNNMLYYTTLNQVTPYPWVALLRCTTKRFRPKCISSIQHRYVIAI